MKNYCVYIKTNLYAYLYKYKISTGIDNKQCGAKIDYNFNLKCYIKMLLRTIFDENVIKPT